MLRYFRWLPGLFGGLLMWMTQVGPSEAEINFCKWIKIVAQSAENKCLAIPHLDWIISAIAICLLAISIALVFGWKGKLSFGAKMVLAWTIFAASLVGFVFALSMIASGPARSLPINEDNLTSYMRSSPLVGRVDERISKGAMVPIESEGSCAWPAEEQAHLLGISSIAELDRMLSENEEATYLMSSFSWPTKKLGRGESIIYLLDVLAAQLGIVKFIEFTHLVTLSTWGESPIKNYEAVKIILKNNGIKHKVRMPLVPDFNLIPLATAIKTVRVT